MKTFMPLLVAALSAKSITAFTTNPITSQLQSAVTSTARPMGLFDFFSEDARKEREERKQREVEEQERYQREIIARRSNPQKMEEYEAKVRVRRNLRMAGNDEAAEMMEMYTGDDDEKIVGLN